MARYDELENLDPPTLDALVKMMVWVVYSDFDEELSESMAVIRLASQIGWEYDEPAGAVIRWAEELKAHNNAQLQEACTQLAARIPSQAQRTQAIALFEEVARADGKVMAGENLLIDWIKEAFEKEAP